MLRNVTFEAARVRMIIINFFQLSRAMLIHKSYKYKSPYLSYYTLSRFAEIPLLQSEMQRFSFLNASYVPT